MKSTYDKDVIIFLFWLFSFDYLHYFGSGIYERQIWTWQFILVVLDK